MTKVEISFDNDEKAHLFMHWLNTQGEQKLFEYLFTIGTAHILALEYDNKNFKVTEKLEKK